MCLYVLVCACMCLYVPACACMCLYVFVCVCMCLYVLVCACIHMQPHTYIQTQTVQTQPHKYTNTHTHTQINHQLHQTIRVRVCSGTRSELEDCQDKLRYSSRFRADSRASDLQSPEPYLPELPLQNPTHDRSQQHSKRRKAHSSLKRRKRT